MRRRFEVTAVEIRPPSPSESGFVALVAVTIDGCLRIDAFALTQRPGGVVLDYRYRSTESGPPIPVVEALDNEVHRVLTHAVLAELQRISGPLVVWAQIKPEPRSDS